MGALSSWAMLAITHHLIAQLAAHRVRILGGQDPLGYWRLEWYEGYEVLGDDIVFFEEQVAKQYLLIMSELGVPINLAKSVIAVNPTFEFAKVTGHYACNVAAVSWAMFMSQPTVMGRVGICFALLRKGIVKNHLIRYITRFSRESKYNMGIPNLFFLGLASMFTNSGILKLSDIVHKVITFRDNKLTLVPALFENSYGSIVRMFTRAIVHSTLAPEEISMPLRKDAFIDYNRDNLALKNATIKTIIKFIYGSKPLDGLGPRVNALHPSNDAANLARAIVLDTISFPTQDMSVVESALVAEGAFRLNPMVFRRLSPLGKLIHPLYCHLFFQIYTNLVNKWSALTATPTIKLKSLELSELLDLMDVIDRYKEVLLLIQRKKEKEGNNAVPKDRLIDSPLKVLVNVLKLETKLTFMRDVVTSTCTDFLTRKFAEKDTAFLSIFQDPSDGAPDYPDYRPHPGAPSLAGIRAYVASHGQEFVSEHLPKWGKYAAAMFVEPGDSPRTVPWNYMIAQPDYLYSMAAFDSYFGNKEILVSLYSQSNFASPAVATETYDKESFVTIGPSQEFLTSALSTVKNDTLGDD